MKREIPKPKKPRLSKLAHNYTFPNLTCPNFLGKNTFYVEMSMLQATMAIVLQPTKIFTVQSMYMYIHSNVHVHVIKYRQ